MAYKVSANQPAFFAYLSAGVNNVTGDFTVYTIIFDTVVHDNLGNYDNTTGVFTAPLTGFYAICANVALSTLTGQTYALFSITPSSGQAVNNQITPVPTSFDTSGLNNSTIMYLTAGTTVTCTIQVGNAGATVGLNNNSTTFSATYIG